MKKARMLLLVLLMALAFADIVNSAEVLVADFVVSGYENEQSSIEVKQEEELSPKLDKIKGQYKEGNGLIFSVIGSADKPGTFTINQKVSADRAEQMASRIRDQFPRALVNPWSQGDQENIKQVRVICRFFPDSVAAAINPGNKPPARDPREILIGAISIGLSFIIIITIIAIRVRRKRTTADGGIMDLSSPKEPKEEAEEMMPPEEVLKKPDIVWLPAKRNEKACEVKIEISAKMEDFNGKMVPIKIYRAPFKTLADESQYIFRKDSPNKKNGWRHIKSAVNGCLNDGRYASQIPLLVDSGEIREAS